MLNIALFGPPGAGKGTQSKFLIDKYKLTYIATGDLLREEMAGKTPLGMLAKETIEKGLLVTDDIIVQLIENKIKMNLHGNGFLFDGFPRTKVQAYILDGLLLNVNTQLSCMIALDVPENILVERMLHRAETSNRADDNIDVFKNRLQEYINKTLPVINYYKDKKIFFPVNGMGTVEEVFCRIDIIAQNNSGK